MINERNTKKKLIFILIISILGIAVVSKIGVSYISAGEYSTPNLHVEPSNKTVDAGETFTISVNVGDVTDLNRWEIRMSWDSSVIQLDPSNTDAVEEGSFLKSVGITRFEVSSYQEGSGILSSIRCRLLQAKGVSGSGTLFKLNFKAIGGGKTSITISDSELYDSMLIKIRHDRISGTVSGGSASRDLTVTSLGTPSNLLLGETGQLDVTVENQGSITESSVELSLYANSHLIKNTPVNDISSGGQETYDLQWTPTETGQYNITAYVHPVSGESDAENNALSQVVTVKQPLSHDLDTSFDPKTPDCVTLGNQRWINATVKNIGTAKETDLEATIFVNSEPKKRETSFSLASGESKELSLYWNPSTKGTYNVTIFVDYVTEESNRDNNQKTKDITVINPSAGGSILLVCDNDGAGQVGYQRGTSLPEFADALETTGYDFDVWNGTTRGSPSLADLTPYELVIWTCGDFQDYGAGVPDETDAETLEKYLEQGGNILIEGQRVAWNRVYTYDDFASNVLHVNYATSNEDEPLEVVDFDHPVTNGLPQIINWSRDSIVGTDGVRPVNGGKELIAYNDRYKRSAVVAYNGAEEGTGSVVFYSFPLYWMSLEDRNLLVQNSVNWLNKFGVETVAGKIINAPEQSVYFVYTHPDQVGNGATYDATAGTTVYSLCENSQHQGFTTTKNWFDSSGKINRNEISNSILVNIGNPSSSPVTDYYESTELPPVRSVKNYGEYSFKDQDGETIASISATEVESGDRDLIVIQTFKDGDNTVLNMYGFCWRGTWAAGVYFAEEIAKDLSNNSKQYYILSWEDLSQDEIPQLSEIDVLQTE